MISNITFEYPFVFLILIVFVACDIWCKPKRLSVYFPNIAILGLVSNHSSWILKILKYGSIIALVIALASPVKSDDVILKNDQGYEISLILDASGSMKQQGIDKFAIVKSIVNDFIDKRTHDKLALSIFADFAYVAVPLTYDKKSLKRLLSRLDVGIAGRSKTALYEALFLSSNLFKTSDAKEKIAILLTDGVDNASTIPLEVAIKRAKKYGIKVYTVGVGRAGLEFDPSVLHKISASTGGRYFAGDSVAKLTQIYDIIDKLEKSEIKADKYVKKTYYFQYPLAVAILFMFGFFYIRGKE